MRHRQRYVTTPSMVTLRTWYTGKWPPKDWITSTSFTNSQARTLYPNARAEHCYDELHAGPPYKDGGPFNKWTFSTNAAWPQSYGIYISRRQGVITYKSEGGFTSSLNPSIDLFPVGSLYKDPGKPATMPGGNHSWGDVSAYGPVGWKRFRPGRNTADAGIFIGEARDIPRMLRTTARGFYEAYKRRFGRNPKGNLKKAADHWLNHQFGWMPFVSDLRRFYRTWFNADRVIRQLVEQNGQWQRRFGTVLTDQDQSVVYDRSIGSAMGHSLLPALGDPYYPDPNPGYGRETLTRVTSQRVWFVGRFRYYIPNIQSVQWKKAAVQRLFGLELTPSLVWELTPWSWLVDWFTNVGDVLDNISNPGLAENLAAKYAYVMGETRCELDLTVRLNTISPVTAIFNYSLSRKVRMEANPFGFGLTWEGLTPKQWSILGALGITRMH